jgi:hypothetical protein
MSHISGTAFQSSECDYSSQKPSSKGGSEPPWIEALCKIRRQIQEAERRIADDPGKRVQKPKEQVVNSPMICWKPIDRTAALVVAPAQWIHKPPDVRKQQPRKERKPRTMSSKMYMDESVVEPERSFPHQYPAQKANSGVPKDHNPQEYFSVHDMAVRIIDEINRQPQKLTDLARAAVDARGVLLENLKDMGSGMEDFNARTKAALDDVRQTRFAFVTEITQMLHPLRELRQFLLGSDYETEITRLSTFVDLCERLQKLKKDGTLDAIADTMIKLAVQ